MWALALHTYSIKSNIFLFFSQATTKKMMVYPSWLPYSTDFLFGFVLDQISKEYEVPCERNPCDSLCGMEQQSCSSFQGWDCQPEETAVLRRFLTFLAQIYGHDMDILRRNCPELSFPGRSEATNILDTPGKGYHRLLNWQIQTTKVSWVGQSTRGGVALFPKVNVKILTFFVKNKNVPYGLKGKINTIFFL